MTKTTNTTTPISSVSHDPDTTGHANAISIRQVFISSDISRLKDASLETVDSFLQNVQNFIQLKANDD